MEDILLTEKIVLDEKAKAAGKRLLRHLWKYRKPFGFGLLCTILATLLNSSSVLLIKFVIDDALDGKNESLLLLICLAIVSAFLLKGAFSFARTMLVTLAGVRLVEDLRNEAHKSLHAMSLGYFEKQRAGELMSRLMNDTGMINMFVTSTVAEAVMIPIAVIVDLGIVIYLSAKLTLLALCLSPIIILAIASAGMKMKRLSHTVMEVLADLQSVLFEILYSIHVVKAFSMEKHEINRFAIENRINVKISMKQTRVRAMYTPLVELLGAGCLAIIFWVGGRDVIHHTPDFITGKVLTKGDIIAIFVGLQQLFTQFNRINQTYLTYQHSFASAERVFKMIDLEPDVREKPGAVEISPVVGRVEFRDVCFEYNPDEPVLKNISVIAEPGMVVALVGSSGAGKSTLVKLVPRFYDVTGGAVLIDNTDVRDAKTLSYRQHIGIVPQETLLFHGTIRDNIAYGKPEATDEEIEAAARDAYAHDFIMEMPDGYKSHVTEQGLSLSGGQRQRIAIARAILKDPRILILDEATSNVDSVSEKYIQEALDRLMKGRTTLVIAHRLSTVKNADLILVLDHGQIVERGRHNELYNSGGVYKKLYETTLSLETHSRNQETQT